MKKTLPLLALIPLMNVLCFILLTSINDKISLILGICLILATLIGFIMYLIYKPFSIWFLVGGFAISFLPMVIFEFFVPAQLQYIGTLIIIAFYSLPGLLVTLISGIVLSIKKYVEQKTRS